MEQNRSFVSCMKIKGVPILPPLITPERRKEMQEYRERAVLLEQSYQKKQQDLTEETKLVNFPSNTTVMILESNESSSKKVAEEAEMQYVPYACRQNEIIMISTDNVNTFENNSNRIQIIPHIDDCHMESKFNEKKPKEYLISEVFEKDSHQMDDTTKPRLIRSNSYTLETPSSILLEHLKRQSVSACEQTITTQNSEGDNCSEGNFKKSEKTKNLSIHTVQLSDSNSNICNTTTDVSSHLDATNNQPSFEVITTDITVQQINFTTRDNNENNEVKRDTSETTDIQSHIPSNPDPETELKLILQQIPENYAKKIMMLIEEQKKEQKRRIMNYELKKSKLLQSGDFEKNDLHNIPSPKKIFVTSASNMHSDNVINSVNIETDRSGSQHSHYWRMEKSVASSLNESQTLPFDLSTSSSESLDNFSLKTFKILDIESTADKKISSQSRIESYITEQTMTEDDMQRINEINNLKQKEIQRMREEKAASVIGAYAKGYLVRRLMNTIKVNTIIRTIQDALVCALELQSSETIDEADVELHRKLIKLVSSACYEFHDIFFSLTIPEQMDIIAMDREKAKKPLAVRSTRSSTEFRHLNEPTKIRTTKSLTQI